MNCPYCGKPQDSGAQVRVFDRRFHKPCWVLWLQKMLENETNSKGELDDPQG